MTRNEFPALIRGAIQNETKVDFIYRIREERYFFYFKGIYTYVQNIKVLRHFWMMPFFSNNELLVSVARFSRLRSILTRSLHYVVLKTNTQMGHVMDNVKVTLIKSPKALKSVVTVRKFGCSEGNGCWQDRRPVSLSFLPSFYLSFLSKLFY